MTYPNPTGETPHAIAAGDSGCGCGKTANGCAETPAEECRQRSLKAMVADKLADIAVRKQAGEVFKPAKRRSV